MDARELSVALTRLYITYLNDGFGNPRRKSKPSEKENALEVRERVWTLTPYGEVAGTERDSAERAPLKTPPVRRAAEGDGAGRPESAPDGRRESPRPAPKP